MKKIIVLVLLAAALASAQYKISTTVTIAAGQTTSSIVDLDHYTLVGVKFPSAMTGTSLTVLTSNDTSAASFKQAMYDGSAVTITVTADKYNQLVPSQVWGLLRYIKLVSSSAEASQRILTVHKRPL